MNPEFRAGRPVTAEKRKKKKLFSYNDVHAV